MVHFCLTNSSSCEDVRYRADAILFRMDAFLCRMSRARLRDGMMPEVDGCSGLGSRRPRPCLTSPFSPCHGDTSPCEDDYGLAPIRNNYIDMRNNALEERCLREMPRPPACAFDRQPNCVTDEPTRCPAKVFERFAYNGRRPDDQKPWLRCELAVGHEGDHEAGCLVWGEWTDILKEMGR